MPAAELRTLGAFEFSIDGRAIARPSTQKARALLAFLAMKSGESVAREAIVDAFWPESDADNARQSLKTALWSIRRALRGAGVEPDEVFTADNFTIRWRAPVWIDAVEFERAALAGDASAPEAYAGDFLPGDYDLWPSAQRERLLSLLERALVRALERREGGVAAAQRLLEIDPFSEIAYATLIDAEVSANRIVAAQTLLQRLRTILRENGLEASPEFACRFASLEAAPAASPLSDRFLGRAKELALFERTLHAKQPSTILVHADAGFGKTTLLEQFRRRAAEAGRTVVSVAIRREAHGFGGWENVYRERAGAPVEELVVQRGESQAGAMAAAILTTLPPGSYAFVDDATHLQGESAYVAGAIARGAGAAGVNLVVATRPEGLERALAIVPPDAVDVPLGGLSEDEIRLAIAERGEEGDEFARRLYARTHGHPLFLQRVLERCESGDDQLEMPAGVRGLIKARLGERGEDAAAIARLLALDPSFGSDELATILGWDEERVLDAIDDLLALGIVRESQGSSHLQFAHDLVMEVARDSMSPQRRRSLHRRAAEFLDETSTLSEMTRCAEHHAGGGSARRAAELYVRCSEAAFAAFEPRNATLLADRAREQVTRLKQTPEAASLARRADIALVKALNAAHEPHRAEAVATAAIAASRSGDERDLLETVLLRMRARMRTSNLAGIDEDARRAMELARGIGNSSSFAEAALGLLQSSLQRLNREDALRYGKLAFEAAVEGGDDDLAVFVASEYLHAQALFWQFAEALETMRRSDALLADGARTTEPNFQYAAAQLMHLLGRYDEADRRIDRGLELISNGRLASGRYIPDRQRTIAILTNVRAFIALEKREFARAWESARAFAENPAAQIPALRPHVVDICTRILLARNEPGDTERAAELLDSLDASALVDDTNTYASAARARVAARRGDPRAPELLDAAIELAERTASVAGLDADVLFGHLAEAARECGAANQAARADELHDRYYARRRAAAGDAWGGAA
jgi:DNA-binding SARP family transcriptional activator